MEVLETDASSSFVCDYVAGVNRVLSLPPYLLVDNIGRNFELWRFAPGGREPAGRARYDQTAYPGDQIASLLDVDIHAAFVRREGRELLAVNHYGCVRAFDVPPPGARLEPVWERQLLGDTERVVMAGDCFITSSPRGEFTDDPAQPGVLLFEPIAALPGRGAAASGRLGCEQVLTDWGVVSAVAVSARADRLVVAAGQRLGVFALASGDAGARLGDCLWEAALRFECQWLNFDGTDHLWAGGHRPSSSAADGDDWDACRGGAVERFGIGDGARDRTAALPEGTAWGYGADPIVLGADSRELYALGRDASLHVVDTGTGESRRVCDGFEAPGDGKPPSFGIGHAALRDGWIYAGFSRGGFRVLRYDVQRVSAA
jgi:hypothetical protein